jgi:hypothetical protein
VEVFDPASTQEFFFFLSFSLFRGRFLATGLHATVCYELVAVDVVADSSCEQTQKMAVINGTGM